MDRITGLSGTHGVKGGERRATSGWRGTWWEVTRASAELQWRHLIRSNGETTRQTRGLLPRPQTYPQLCAIMTFLARKATLAVACISIENRAFLGDVAR